MHFKQDSREYIEYLENERRKWETECEDLKAENRELQSDKDYQLIAKEEFQREL